MQESSYDPKRRKLCPDGACIGLIGDDGRCKECGRAAGSGAVDLHPVGSSLSAVSEEDDEINAAAAPEPTEEREAALDAAPGNGTSGSFDPARRLCDDGSCVGVVVNKACSVCGRVQE
jgi:hypothetical protein